MILFGRLWKANHFYMEDTSLQSLATCHAVWHFWKTYSDSSVNELRMQTFPYSLIYSICRLLTRTPSITLMMLMKNTKHSIMSVFDLMHEVKEQHGFLIPKIMNHTNHHWMKTVLTLCSISALHTTAISDLKSLTVLLLCLDTCLEATSPSFPICPQLNILGADEQCMC